MAVVFPKVCDEHHSPLHQCLPPVALLRELLGPAQDSQDSPKSPSLWMEKTRTKHLEKFYKEASSKTPPWSPETWCHHLLPFGLQILTLKLIFHRFRSIWKYRPFQISSNSPCPHKCLKRDTSTTKMPALGLELPFSFKVSLTSQSIVCGPSSYMPLPASWWLVRWQVTWMHGKECKLQDSLQGGVEITGYHCQNHIYSPEN